MKNFKNFAFGLLVAVLAVGFSAFTRAEQKNNTATFLVQDSEDHWVVSMTEPQSTECEPGADRQCYYEVIGDVGAGNEFDRDDIDSFLQSPAKIQNGANSSLGLYNP